MTQWAVYRCFNAQGDLLYVGASRNPAARYESHASQSAWMQTVVQIAIEWFPSRSEALFAERQAIIKEAPRHNAPPSERPGRRKGKCHCTGDLAALFSLFDTAEDLRAALSCHPLAPSPIKRSSVTMWKQRDAIPHAWRPVAADILAKAVRSAA